MGILEDKSTADLPGVDLTQIKSVGKDMGEEPEEEKGDSGPERSRFERKKGSENDVKRRAYATARLRVTCYEVIGKEIGGALSGEATENFQVSKEGKDALVEAYAEYYEQFGGDPDPRTQIRDLLFVTFAPMVVKVLAPYIPRLSTMVGKIKAMVPGVNPKLQKVG